ncbi:hypothetical protein T484DRAFT_1963526 [Baffinella frigidus]|nr:hypothetical protein T484DRAFT_1963526 [Cryptophyta sp. CCMP2293]
MASVHYDSSMLAGFAPNIAAAATCVPNDSSSMDVLATAPHHADEVSARPLASCLYAATPCSRTFLRKKQGKPRPTAQPVLLHRALVESMFGLPLKIAAAELGMCPTSLKKACRKLDKNSAHDDASAVFESPRDSSPWGTSWDASTHNPSFSSSFASSFSSNSDGSSPPRTSSSASSLEDASPQPPPAHEANDATAITLNASGTTGGDKLTLKPVSSGTIMLKDEGGIAGSSSSSSSSSLDLSSVEHASPQQSSSYNGDGITPSLEAPSCTSSALAPFNASGSITLITRDDPRGPTRLLRASSASLHPVARGDAAHVAHAPVSPTVTSSHVTWPALVQPWAQGREAFQEMEDLFHTLEAHYSTDSRSDLTRKGAPPIVDETVC